MIVAGRLLAFVVVIAACGGSHARSDAPIGGDGVTVDGALPDAAMPDGPASTVTAPPLDPDVPTSFADATSFLYTGPNAIQTGVAPGAIDPKRVVVLRGKVTDRAGTPLVGVTATIVGHAEFGQTLTRSDGMFDLAANGGGLVVVHLQTAAFLLAQRQVQAPILDYVDLPDISLVARDGAMTTVTMGAADIQVARGSMQSDASGSRRATVLFPAGTTGSLVQPDGSTVPAASLDVRLTEYTVGPNGPAAMPGTLPASSGYTYAVELGVDQAVAKVNGRDVVFDNTVYLYVENFQSFPVGEVVPVGYYDPAKSAWVGSKNGLVIKLLDASGALDVTGDDVADTGAALTALGITDAERARIASLYPVGQTLWRTPMDHFSTIDCNWGVICTGDCTPPVERPPAPSCTGQSPKPHSIVGCERQTLGEEVALPGSTMTLHYQSDRVPGRTAEANLALSLGNSGVPAGVVGTEVEVLVAGQRLAQSVSPTTLETTATWNGNDPYGRPVVGSQPFTVRVGYRYKVVYAKAVVVRLAWAALSGIPLVGNPARMDVTLYQEWHGMIRRWSNGAQGLGGWSLDEVHAYDPVAHVLHLGDGTDRDASGLGAVTIDTIAGTANGGALGDGGPATAAHLSGPQAVAVGPDGTVFVADNGNLRVRKVALDGTISTVAGSTFGNSGDGGPATAAQFKAVTDIAVGPDGSLYIADAGAFVVRRVAPDGTIYPFAGSGSIAFGGDTGPATAAGMEPYGLAVGPDGTVYVADRQGARIRVIDQSGIINTFAGSTSSGFSGDGGPATAARLSGPTGVAVGPDGSVLVMDRSNNRVRKVSPQGIISTIAGSGAYGATGDGGPATAAKIASPNHVAVGPDGTLYIADFNNDRVRAVGSEGIITTIAGTGGHGFAGDTGLAPAATLAGPDGIATAPDGTIYLSDFYNNRVRQLRAALPGATANETVVPSTAGDELYVFDNAGRHLRTLDALTGAVRLVVTYGAHGIASLDDGDGNVTTIERDAAGAPTAIASPHGFRETLAVDPHGYLAQLTDPGGASVGLVASSSGLLGTMTDRRGGPHTFTYDALGRLTRDQDPTGSTLALARTATPDATTIAVTTSLGVATTYTYERLDTGDLRHVRTLASGAITTAVRGTDGGLTVTEPDGTTEVTVAGPDPRYGMLAPIAATNTRTTPGGLARTTTQTRTSTLVTPGNPLDIATLTETLAVNGRTWTRVYTRATNTITLTSPAGRVVTATLDPRGRVATAQATGQELYTFTYDTAGRLTGVSAGAGATLRTTGYTYGADGLVATRTDELGAVETYSYDADGRPTQTVGPDTGAATRTIAFAHDAAGNLTSLTPPGRGAHVLALDGDDLAAMYTPPGGLGGTIVARDGDRRLSRETLADASTIDIGYDTSDRVASVGIARGSIALAYDTVDRLQSLTAPGAIVESYTYDGDLGTTNTLAGPIAGSVARTFDTAFRPATLAVDGASALGLAYDADDLLIGAGAMTIARHPQHGLVTGTTLGVVTDAWSYNGYGDPTAYTASVSGTAKLADTDVRDAAGRLTQRTETILGTTTVDTYHYDAARRLIGVDVAGVPTEAYAYDANGDRISAGIGGAARTATFDAQDRLATDGTTTFAYTAAGFLASSVTAGATTSYTYDALGYLLGVTLPGTTVTYLVDARGDRIGKRVGGTLVQGFLYESHLRPIAELDGTGAVVSRFVYGTRANVPDYFVKGGATYRIIADALGSPRLVIDTASGAIAQRLDYDAFGNVTADTNPGLQPFGFAGGLYDRDTQLVHFGARDYDPRTGRWTAKDPWLFDAGDPDVYAYGFDDPVNHRDPTGRADPAPPSKNLLPNQPLEPPDRDPGRLDPFNPQKDKKAPPPAACGTVVTKQNWSVKRLEKLGLEKAWKFLNTQDRTDPTPFEKQKNESNDHRGTKFPPSPTIEWGNGSL